MFIANFAIQRDFVFRQKKDMTRKAPILFLGLAALVTLVYSNHFGNDFHFDDFHTIVQNPYIRDLHNLPKFFVNTDTSSVLPANRTWRPLVFCVAGHRLLAGERVEAFLFSSCRRSCGSWCCSALMFALFRKVFDAAWIGSETADACSRRRLFGVHPAMAETVNYIIQRADLYSTLGVVASLVMWIYLPGRGSMGCICCRWRRRFCANLRRWFFRRSCFFISGCWKTRSLGLALRSSHSIAGGSDVALAWLSGGHDSEDRLRPGRFRRTAYRITQPIVIFRYFRTFFLPTGLTRRHRPRSVQQHFRWRCAVRIRVRARADLRGVSRRSGGRRRDRSPSVCSGFCWLLLPTSIFPLAEVENDHRMFFPFVGPGAERAAALAVWLGSRPVRARNVAVAGLRGGAADFRGRDLATQ